MSEKKDKADAAPEGEAAPKSKKKLIMFIAIGVVVLVLIIGGVIGYMMMKKPKLDENGDPIEEEQTSETEKKKGAAKEGKDGHAAAPTFYKFDKPFTVKLAAEDGDAYLQVDTQMKLLDAHGADAIKAAEPELKHKITLLLLSKKASDLNNSKGVEMLAWQIRDAVNHTLHPPKKKKGAAATHEEEPGPDVDAEAPVQAVVFTTFIIQ